MEIPILKNCPFCGGVAKLFKFDPYDGYQGNCTEYRIRCTKCGAMIVSCQKNNIVQKWNRRTK